MVVAAARIGLGQRTVAVPIFRHPLVFIMRLGSRSPNLLATTSTAGAAVSAAATTITRAIADG